MGVPWTEVECVLPQIEKAQIGQELKGVHLQEKEDHQDPPGPHQLTGNPHLAAEAHPPEADFHLLKKGLLEEVDHLLDPTDPMKEEINTPQKDACLLLQEEEVLQLLDHLLEGAALDQDIGSLLQGKRRPLQGDRSLQLNMEVHLINLVNHHQGKQNSLLHLEGHQEEANHQ